MGCIKKLLFRMKKAIDTISYMTLSTTSTSATWSPQTVTNTGATLTWDVTGDIAPTSQNLDVPTFDLSANTGTVNMNVYDVSNLTIFEYVSGNITAIDVSHATSLSQLNLNANQLTNLDVTKNPHLVSLGFNNSSITTIDLSNNLLLQDFYPQYCPITSLNLSLNTALINVYADNMAIPSLDISNNINITYLSVQANNMIPSATDQIFIDLDANGKSNGTLTIRNNRTSASDAARANLITKGWTITDTYTT